MDEKTYKLIGPDYPGNRAEDIKNPSLGWMIGFMFVVSFLGLFSLVPLRKVFLEFTFKLLIVCCILLRSSVCLAWFFVCDSSMVIYVLVLDLRIV